MSQNRQRLQERGEKLDELGEKSEKYCMRVVWVFLGEIAAMLFRSSHCFHVMCTYKRLSQHADGFLAMTQQLRKQNQKGWF